MLVKLTISFVIWAAYYLFLTKSFQKCSAEWISRVLAVSHSLIACFSIEWCIFTTPWLLDKLGSTNTNEENRAVFISAGYFIFEVLWCLYMKTEGVLMLLHHVISLSSLIGCAYMQKSGAEVVLTTWGSELTNPFLQVRWFLLESKQYDSKFAYINDAVFVTMFFVARLCLGSYLLYRMHYATKPIILMKLGGYCFYAIGLVWCFQIFKFATKRMNKFSKRKFN